MLKNAIRHNHIPVQKSTFKAGLSAHVHKWFRLTPSFGPDLVREMISQLDCSKDEIILDPYSGASTTVIESKLEGYKSYGFEINPFLHWVGKTSTEWDLSTNSLETDKNEIARQCIDQKRFVSFENLIDHNLKIPPIHNPLRWWRKDVITDLLILKRAIHECSTTEKNKNFFLLALAGVLVPDLTNVTLGKLQLHFIDRTSDDIDVLSTFLIHVDSMMEDVQSISSLNLDLTSKVFLTDSTSLKNIDLSSLDPINCVITSPPYPNRYSYVWNTRPHLFFFDIFSTPKESAALDKETIGGTWGSATSMLEKGIIEPSFDFLKEDVWNVVEDIRIDDNLMANYVMKYFNLISEQICAMEKLPQENLRCAYVIGNSRIKGRYIESDVLLAQIFDSLGYKINSIDRIRKRNSGKDLFESIVYATKNK